ncbi:MAG: OsmC family protein [Thermomicrobiales bacterium]
MAVVTIETQPGKAFATNVRTATHELVADEPVADGGDGLGLSPYDMLLSALGSCTAMTLQLYAKRKGWPLERVQVTLEFDRIHEVDSEHVENASRRIDRIQRAFVLDGPLTDEQRARLLEIAARCPVHRTITGRPRIIDKLSNSSSLAEAMM